MNVKGIHLSWIVVNDLEKAVSFYRDVIGLKLHEMHAEFGWAELSGPSGAILGLAQYKNDDSDEMQMKAGSNAVVTISVNDIEEAISAYRKNGVKLIGKTVEVPGHVKLQTFQDESGNTFQLAQLLA